MMFKPKRQANFNLNLIPLINVIFLLLIFFVVAGTVEEVDIFEISVPESTKGDKRLKEQSILYIGKDGSLALNNDLIEERDIKTIISTVLIEDPDQPISIKADSSVPVEKLIWAMNLIEELGGKNVYLITEQKNKKYNGS